MAMDKASRVMNGTFGQLWREGEEIAELSAFQAKVAYTYDTVQMCGQVMEDRKLVSAKGTGSMTLHKVYTRGADHMEKALRGIDVRDTLVGKLADPDAFGAERVALYGVSYDEQTLLDFEAGKAGKTTVAFQFTGVKYLDRVGA